MQRVVDGAQRRTLVVAATRDPGVRAARVERAAGRDGHERRWLAHDAVEPHIHLEGLTALPTTDQTDDAFTTGTSLLHSDTHHRTPTNHPIAHHQ